MNFLDTLYQFQIYLGSEWVLSDYVMVAAEFW